MSLNGTAGGLLRNFSNWPPERVQASGRMIRHATVFCGWIFRDPLFHHENKDEPQETPADDEGVEASSMRQRHRLLLFLAGKSSQRGVQIDKHAVLLLLCYSCKKHSG